MIGNHGKCRLNPFWCFVRFQEVKVHICIEVTHRTVADVPLVGGSDSGFHVMFLQDAVGKPHMKGEHAAPVEGAGATSKNLRFVNMAADVAAGLSWRGSSLSPYIPPAHAFTLWLLYDQSMFDTVPKLSVTMCS